MVERQLRRRGIADERVLAAMGEIPRELFLPPRERARAYDDGAVRIGEGQTMSQPWIVASMTQLLELDGDERVLEVGTGSGYGAAVLSRCSKEVVTIERHPSLADRARSVLAELGYDNVEVRVGDGTRGVPERAPFAGIAVAAAAPDVPPSLYQQLEIGGRLVVPVGDPHGQRLLLAVRSPEGPAVVRSVPCRFVPLVGEEGF